MKQFYVLVRTKNEPGAMVIKAFIMSDNVFNAYALAKGMYGDLMYSNFASPVI